VKRGELGSFFRTERVYIWFSKSGDAKFVFLFCVLFSATKKIVVSEENENFPKVGGENAACSLFVISLVYIVQGKKNQQQEITQN
jgi:hypothetical protein